jgi:hypothetical protein
MVASRRACRRASSPRWYLETTSVQTAFVGDPADEERVARRTTEAVSLGSGFISLFSFWNVLRAVVP